MTLESDLKSCLMWEVERPDIGESRQSSYFRMLGEDWYLKLSIYSGPRHDSCYVWLYRRNGEGDKTLRTALSTTCSIHAGERILGGGSEQRTVRKSRDALREIFLPKGNLTSSAEKWTVYCRLSCVEPLSLQITNETMLISTGPASTVTDHFQWLSDDFSRLLKEEIEPDATLTCGDRTWRVHRSVLGVRSEVFAAMFRSGMAESQTGAVRVEDLEAPVLDSLLKYVYCGEVPDLTVANVSGMYEAADRYALLGLRKACSNWMVGNLTEENCLSLLVTADAHGDAELKEAVASFIAEHFTEIGDEIWSNFMKEHPFLAMAVLLRFAPSKKE